MMKPMIFAALMVLALGTNNTRAEWMLVAETADQELALYADPTTAQFSGNTVTVWTLHNYRSFERTSAGEKYRSEAVRYEFDCVNAGSRPHALTIYSGSMGSGKVIKSVNSIGPWSALTPGGVGYAMLAATCPKG